jgi:Skp family chaperone for outer membrane proteins
MKTISKTIVIMGISAMAGLSAPALAADAPAAAPAAGGLTFGIVDMNKVMQTTDAAKDVFSQMEAKRKEYQGQISKEEDTLRAAGQDLEKQKETLGKDAYEQKGKALQEKFVNEQKLVQDRKRILDQAFSAAVGKLRTEAAKIVASIAKERHYSAVFTEDAVMISTPDLDMTDVVIDQLNKSVKKIPVDWAAAAADDESGKKK